MADDMKQRRHEHGTRGRRGLVRATGITALLLASVLPRATFAQGGNGILDRVEALELGIDWQEPDLGAGWTVYSDYQPFRYGKTHEDIVILTGMMSGCASRETPVLVLPEGYRPSKPYIFSVASVRGGAISVGHVYVNSDGKVTFYEAYQPWGFRDCDIDKRPTASWMSFSGIAFPSADSLEE